MEEEREILTWELFGKSSRDLAQLVADDGYAPEMILRSPAAACSSAARWATPSA